MITYSKLLLMAIFWGGTFVPISAILLAFLFLKEPITLSLLMGTIMVVGGVYLTNRPTR
jgi:drug/metabolite transporter (DMT)-like permease